MKERKKQGPKKGTGRSSSPRIDDPEKAPLFEQIDMRFRQLYFRVLGIDSEFSIYVKIAIDWDEPLIESPLAEMAGKAAKNYDAEFFFEIGEVIKRFREIQRGERPFDLIAGYQIIEMGWFMEGKTPTFRDLDDELFRRFPQVNGTGYSRKRRWEEAKRAGIRMARGKPGPRNYPH